VDTRNDKALADPPATPDPAPPRRSYPYRRLAVAVVLLVAAAAVVVWRSQPTTRPLVVGAARDDGTLVQPRDWLRDGAESALVGDRIFWIFGDTLFPDAAEDGSHLRTNSSAWSRPSLPTRLHTPVDANHTPLQLIPFDDVENSYNSLANKPDDRIALWPTAVLGRPDGSAVVLYSQVKISPGALNFSFQNFGLATVAPGSETAVRDPTPILGAPEPSFWSGPVERDGFVYLYGCDKIEGVRFGCRVARVPSDDLHDRSAWEFWDGSEWTSDLGRAVFAMEGPNGGLSVSWNPWLGRFLAVYMPGYTNEVVFRTADRPEGPWSAPVVAFRGAEPAAGAVNYGAFEHPELSTDGGRSLVVTYFHPLGPLQGEIRVVRVRLD